MAVAQNIDERVHVALGREVDARPHMAQRRVNVLRVRRAQSVQGFPVLLNLIPLGSRLLSPKHPCGISWPSSH